MSSVTAESVATAPTEKRKSGLVSMFEHTKYVLGENRVTAFAFGLLVVILFAAIFGPWVVPYDPLASDTAQALKSPSAALLWDVLVQAMQHPKAGAPHRPSELAVTNVSHRWLSGGQRPARAVSPTRPRRRDGAGPALGPASTPEPCGGSSRPPRRAG